MLESTIAALDTPPRELIAWLGPAIGLHFEVGTEVREAFMRIDPSAVTAFRANARGRWMCDLYRIAHQHLNRVGIDAIFGNGRYARSGKHRASSRFDAMAAAGGWLTDLDRMTDRKLRQQAAVSTRMLRSC